MKIAYLQNIDVIPLGYHTTDKSNRVFEVLEELEITLSDGYVLIIPEGFTTDLISVPKWIWSFIRPFDKALLAAILHDALWVFQLEEIKRHGGVHQAREFADKEFKKWRYAIAPELKVKNFVSYHFIRLFGSLFYSHQIQIPN